MLWIPLLLKVSTVGYLLFCPKNVFYYNLVGERSQGSPRLQSSSGNLLIMQIKVIEKTIRSLTNIFFGNKNLLGITRNVRDSISMILMLDIKSFSSQSLKLEVPLFSTGRGLPFLV